ncbi:uncharacterized protein LOC126905441 [Daktulosphaira vitifoliae]|uniref:uncharacterized protein LOC126905441 n=1 Tax=Daktulosphaira vitifoliae TaxID=58002 RepID=UPI0021A98424|nr:uncharacterized protein LOC126905441 [Daktulosphaira vitifoliae]
MLIARNLIRHFMKFSQTKMNNKPKLYICVGTRCLSSIYEPDYLDRLKPDIPEYEEINVQIKGYDFAVLESFQKFVHATAENMDIEVSNGWALPPKIINVKRLVPNSENVETQYNLNVYERNIQVVDVPSNKLSLLIEVIEYSLPVGVSVSIHPHTEEHETLKYIPDNELQSLKEQLEEMGGSKKKK